MLESRAQRSALGTAPDRSAVDVGLNFSLSENLTELLKNHMSNKQMARVPSPRPISHNKKPVSICTNKMKIFFCDFTTIRGMKLGVGLG